MHTESAVTTESAGIPAVDDLTIEELDDVSAAGDTFSALTVSCVISCFGDL